MLHNGRRIETVNSCAGPYTLCDGRVVDDVPPEPTRSIDLPPAWRAARDEKAKRLKRQRREKRLRAAADRAASLLGQHDSLDDLLGTLEPRK